jgi:hypothetical protein
MAGRRALHRDYQDGSDTDKFAWEVTLNAPVLAMVARFQTDIARHPTAHGLKGKRSRDGEDRDRAVDAQSPSGIGCVSNLVKR